MSDQDAPPTKRMPTVVDVARRAGVSQGTVSRYLNGPRVKEENRKRIADAIEEMNYTRNAVATAVRATSRRMIGILLPVFDGFHAKLLDALAVTLSTDRAGTLAMCHGPSIQSTKDALAYFQLHRVDAVVISGSEGCSQELF